VIKVEPGLPHVYLSSAVVKRIEAAVPMERKDEELIPVAFLLAW
jgi:hypothetical protein